MWLPPWGRGAGAAKRPPPGKVGAVGRYGGWWLDRVAGQVHTTYMTTAAATRSSKDAPLGDQLDQIIKDMDAAYATVRAANATFDSPEYEAVETVYVRLRAWNESVAQR